MLEPMLQTRKGNGSIMNTEVNICEDCYELMNKHKMKRISMYQLDLLEGRCQTNDVAKGCTSSMTHLRDPVLHLAQDHARQLMLLVSVTDVAPQVWERLPVHGQGVDIDLPSSTWLGY
jgi:hypothetical protein